MHESFAMMTRWIVVFLVIFLLCMLLVFSWLKRPRETATPVRV